MKTVRADVPDQLWRQANTMIERGWVDNLDTLIADSLRRYIESHQEAMTEPDIPHPPEEKSDFGSSADIRSP